MRVSTLLPHTHTHPPLSYTQQGVIEDGAPQETAVLDYAIHQHKLLTLLAAAYAWHFQVRKNRRERACVVSVYGRVSVSVGSGLHYIHQRQTTKLPADPIHGTQQAAYVLKLNDALEEGALVSAWL